MPFKFIRRENIPTNAPQKGLLRAEYIMNLT